MHCFCDNYVNISAWNFPSKFFLGWRHNMGCIFTKVKVSGSMCFGFSNKIFLVQIVGDPATWQNSFEHWRHAARRFHHPDWSSPNDPTGRPNPSSEKKTIYWTTYCNAQPFFFFVELCLVYMHSAQNASFLSVRLRRTSPHLLDKSRQREHASIELWLRLDFFIKKAPKFPTKAIGEPW